MIATAELQEVLDRTTTQYDVRVPFYGIATSKMPVWHCDLEAYVGDQNLSGVTANEWRLDALGKAHELMKQLREAHWVLADAPRIEFSGTLLEPGRFTLGQDLFSEPIEGLLWCRVTLSLNRYDKDLSK